jgi:hypothetical protein
MGFPLVQNVIARLDRASQYSRVSVMDREARRIGCALFAGMATNYGTNAVRPRKQPIAP